MQLAKSTIQLFVCMFATLLGFLGERQIEIYPPSLPVGERGSCRAWLWLGESLALPVQTILPLALVASSAQDEKSAATVEATKELNEPDAIHEQLRALRETFIAAVNAKDYEAVVALLHPEVVLTAQDGKKLSLIRRHEGVRKYFNRLLAGPGHGVESLKLNPTVDDLSVLYHNNTAVAFGSSIDHYRLVNGNEFDLKTRWSVTVVKEGDKWLLANLHVSTNLFENPVLATVSRMAMWLAIGAGFVCLVAGLFIGRLRSRPIEA